MLSILFLSSHTRIYTSLSLSLYLCLFLPPSPTTTNYEPTRFVQFNKQCDPILAYKCEELNPEKIAGHVAQHHTHNIDVMYKDFTLFPPFLCLAKSRFRPTHINFLLTFDDLALSLSPILHTVTFSHLANQFTL